MNNQRTCATLGMLLLMFLMAGCISGQKPLQTLHYESAGTKNKHLIIFLQGLGGTMNCLLEGHKCFEAEGLVESVRTRNIPFDMMAPNTHFGYYKDRSLEYRLRNDVILPAKAAGYDKIWLGGASMGGLGSLLYLKHHSEDITGVLAMGPFLGDTDIIDEISAAGGLDAWEPGNYDEKEDWQRMLWDWLKGYNRGINSGPPIYLGIGTEDTYYRGQKLLVDYLPPDRVIEIEGKHRFATFKKIWDIFLDNGVLQ
jgi:pimeloyl-ACP methyl ester carboxylesterase